MFLSYGDQAINDKFCTLLMMVLYQYFQVYTQVTNITIVCVLSGMPVHDT